MDNFNKSTRDGEKKRKKPQRPPCAYCLIGTYVYGRIIRRSWFFDDMNQITFHCMLNKRLNLFINSHGILKSVYCMRMWIRFVERQRKTLSFRKTNESKISFALIGLLANRKYRHCSTEMYRNVRS